MKKRFLSVLLAMLMVLSTVTILAITAFATTEAPPIMTLWEGNTTDSITISAEKFQNVAVNSLFKVEFSTEFSDQLVIETPDGSTTFLTAAVSSGGNTDRYFTITSDHLNALKEKGARIRSNTSNVNFTAVKIFAPVSVADVLPEGFPAFDNGVPSNAWTNEYGATLYLNNGKIILKYQSDELELISTDTQFDLGLMSGNTYSYMEMGSHSAYFNMDDNKLASIKCNLYSVNELNGTYEAPAQEPVSYISRAWDSTNKIVTETEMETSDFVVVTDSDGDVSWSAGTYVVKENTTINGNVYLAGNVELILCDGATLTVNGTISLGEWPDSFDLTVYAQANGTGALIVSGTATDAKAIDAQGDYSTLTLNGGNLTLTSVDWAAIHVTTMNVNGGVIHATGGLGQTGGIGAMVSTLNMNGGELYLASVKATTDSKDSVAIQADYIHINGGKLDVSVPAESTKNAIWGMALCDFSLGGTTIKETDTVVLPTGCKIETVAGTAWAGGTLETLLGEKHVIFTVVNNVVHEHDSISFTKWTDETKLPDEAGDYVLTKDVTLSSTWTVPAGKVNLCLNGHVIKMTGIGSVINIPEGATLNLYDCDTETVHKFTPDENGLWVLDEASGTKTVTGGVITGGGAIVNNGTFNLNGGTIAGTASFYGGGVNNNGTFNMTGGAIYGCLAVYSDATEDDSTSSGNGGAIYNNGKLTISGGVIDGCRAHCSGGAIYDKYDMTSFSMTGGTIRNCRADGKKESCGGAIYNDRNGVVLTNVLIENCSASWYGGAIFNNGKLTLDKVTIQNCEATSSSVCLSCGGGIYNSGTYSAVNGTLFGVLEMKNGCVVDGCSAYAYGGGVYSEYSFTISGSEIKNCEVTANASIGGGIYIPAGSVTMTDAKVTANTAMFGGGLTIMQNAFGFISGKTSFSDNMALDEGGAIFNGGSLLVYGETLISGNDSNGYGAGVYNNGTIYLGDKTVISGNVQTLLETSTSRDSDLYGDGGSIQLVPTLYPAVAGMKIGLAKGSVTSATSGDETYFFSNVPTQNAKYVEGSICLVDKVYVAKLGDTKYETLEEAVAAAQNGDIIIIIADIECGRIDTSNKSLTIKPEGKNVTVTLTGPMLFGAVNGGKTFTLCGGDNDETLTIKPKLSEGVNAFRPIAVRAGNTLVMEDGVILAGSHFGGQGGGMVYVYKDASFIMNGGEISDCHIVSTEYDTHNSQLGRGGAIYVLGGGKFAMNGGEIKNCSATVAGGAIYTIGTVEITGGKITGCSVSGLDDNGTVKAKGGAVYLMAGASMTMTGGEISGNTLADVEDMRGAGVYAGIDTSVKLGGTAVITGNTNGNLFLYDGVTITIGTKTQTADGNGVAAPTNGFSVGITTKTAPAVDTPVQLTSNGDSTNTEYFTSDDADYAVIYNTNGYLELHVHNFTGDYIEYDTTNHKWAKKCACGEYDTANALTGVDAPSAATGLAYDGNEKTGVAEATGYTVSNGKKTDAGEYTATATLSDGYIWSDGTTAAKEIKWSIAKATPYIKTLPAPNDITYGQTLNDSTLFGGYAQNSATNTAEVGGLFEWKLGDTAPAVSDSETTEYEVTFTPADTNNYNTVTCKVTLTVNKLAVNEPTVTGTYTYTGSEQSATISGKEAFMTESGAVKGTNAGTYTITYTLDGNHEWATGSDGTVTWSIGKATPYIKTLPAPNDITYGQTLNDSTLFGGYAQNSATNTAEVGGLFEWKLGDTVPAVSDSETTEYEVTFTPADTDNYNTVTCKVTLTVTKATVQAPTITSKVYTGDTLIAEVATSTLYTVTTNNGGTTVGSYNVVLTLSDSANYKWSDSEEATKTLTFMITKAIGKITVDTTTIIKTYGETITLPTATSNFGTVICDTEVADLKNANIYTVTYMLEGTDNYTGDTKTLTVEIEKAVLTVTISDKTSVYGEELVPLTATCDGLAYDDEASDVFRLESDLDYTPCRDVGEYLIWAVDNNGTIARNYDIVYVGTYIQDDINMGCSTYSITKATAVITVDKTPITKTFGEAITLPTATSDFGIVTCDKVASDLINVGTYTVTYTVAGTDNYNGATETVSVTIGKLAVSEPTVTGTYTYTGNEQNATISGKESFMTENGDIKGTNAGTYTITYTLDGNHEWATGSDGTVTWSIAKAQNAIHDLTIGNWKDTENGTAPTATADFGEIVFTYYKGTTRLDAVPTTPGVFTVKAEVAETEDYLGAMADTSFTIYASQKSGGDIGEGETKPVVQIETDNGFDPDIELEVEIVVKADAVIAEDHKAIVDYEELAEKKEVVAGVYDVRLLLNGEEIQPDELGSGTIVTVRMLIPEDLIGKEFRLVHVHAADDVQTIAQGEEAAVGTYIIDDDGYLVTKIDRFSEFVFLRPDTSVSLWWLWVLIALIVIGGAGTTYYFVRKKKKNQ